MTEPGHNAKFKILPGTKNQRASGHAILSVVIARCFRTRNGALQGKRLRTAIASATTRKASWRNAVNRSKASRPLLARPKATRTCQLAGAPYRREPSGSPVYDLSDLTARTSQLVVLNGGVVKDMMFSGQDGEPRGQTQQEAVGFFRKQLLQAMAFFSAGLRS